MKNREAIIKDLAEVINKHSIENYSNTPDFMLGEYLYDCLVIYNDTIVKRNKWYSNRKDDHVIDPMKP